MDRLNGDPSPPHTLLMLAGWAPDRRAFQTHRDLLQVVHASPRRGSGRQGGVSRPNTDEVGKLFDMPNLEDLCNRSSGLNVQ